jgi:hypothetical protein
MASPLMQVFGNKENFAIDPETARANLIAAFFVDAASLTRPLMVAIDSFEQASNDAKQWVVGSFLPSVAYANAIRVVISGREVPEVSGQWSEYCGPVQMLEPVTHPGDWKALIGEMGRRLESTDPDAALAAVCQFAGKNTRELMMWINDRLPLATTP